MRWGLVERGLAWGLVWIACAGPAGCGGNDDDDLGSEGSGSAEGSGGSAEGTDGGPASASQTGDGGGSGDGASGEAGGEGGGESGEIACGEEVCGADEVCVEPCCGGALPACYVVPPGGCLGEDTEVSADQCEGVPCVGDTCCLPGPCTPPPSFCTPTNMLTCPDENNCNIGDCFGMLVGDALQCQCA